MQQLHVGCGTSRGALTVFPVWGDHPGIRGYSLDTASAVLAEQAGHRQCRLWRRRTGALSRC